MQEDAMLCVASNIVGPGHTYVTGLHRLDQLVQLESNAGPPGAPGAAGATAGGDDDEPPVEDIPMDTDEEEDMEYDDYYQVSCHQKAGGAS
eukprot:366131-Chlamydomonas_euryale.AAC.15